MYQIVDCFLYGREGVCTITDIVTRKIKGEEKKYYVLAPQDHHITIFIPIDNKQAVLKMRQVLSKEAIYKLIKAMPDNETIWIEDKNVRKQKYNNIIVNGNHEQLVKLIKTLYLQREKQLKLGKNFHVQDQQFLDTCEKILNQTRLFHLLSIQLIIARKVKMYKIHDYVIVNDYHVYQVVQVNQFYYILSSLINTHTINVDSTSIIKKVPSIDNINEIIERIPYIWTLQIENDRFRQEIYQKTIATFDEVDLIKIIKSVYIRKKRKENHSYENKYYQLAKNLFHEEVAASLNMQIKDVEDYISKKVLEF